MGFAPGGALSILTCSELISFLDDYVAGELSPAAAAAFEAHLAECAACEAYANTYRAAIRLGREALRPDCADLGDVPEELVAAILAARGTTPLS